jgi:hypothetical protein
MATITRNTNETDESYIERLTAANATLTAKAEAKNKLGLKVSEKGGCSLYGLGRFPVTLYVNQWERLLGAAPEIKAFLEANAAKLPRKE